MTDGISNKQLLIFASATDGLWNCFNLDILLGKNYHVQYQKGESEFQTAYDKGMPKSKFWEPAYEDCLNMIALPHETNMSS